MTRLPEAEDAARRERAQGRGLFDEDAANEGRGSPHDGLPIGDARVGDALDDGGRDDGVATKLAAVLLGLVIASAGVLVAAALLGEAPLAHGGPHRHIAGMASGGPSSERTGAVLALGTFFGALQIAFVVVSFALGMRGRGGFAGLRAPILAGALLYVGVWVALVASYARYAADPAAAALWLGFPVPTAILLFVLWPLPLYFVAIYLRAFDRVMPDEAELARFRERIAALRAPDESD